MNADSLIQRRPRRPGLWTLGLTSVAGFLFTAYILLTRPHEGLPPWGAAVVIGLPVGFGVLFLGYVRRYSDHEDGDTLLRYGAAGAVLGGFNFLLVPMVISLILLDRRLAAVLLSQHVLIIEMVMAGAVFGLVIGNLYGRNRAERTRLRRRRAQLDRQRHHLTLLNRVLRHDIRNGINVISAYLSNLQKEITDERSATIIRERCEEILDLSEKARQLESVMNDAETLTESVEIVDVIDRTVETMRREHPSARIRTDLPEEQRVRANELIDSAIANLVENAIEHNDSDSPEVDVSVSIPDGRSNEVEIRVADNGPGLPEQERAIIERGEETTVEHSDGLGLWLVYGIIEDCGGSIEFSGGRSGGTVVTVRLASVNTASG